MLEPERPLCLELTLFALLRRRRFFIVDNAIIAGLRSCLSGRKSFSSQTTLQQFADCCGSARHSRSKTPIVDGLQFLVREHDLQTLTACKLAHSSPLMRSSHATTAAPINGATTRKLQEAFVTHSTASPGFAVKVRLPANGPINQAPH